MEQNTQEPNVEETVETEETVEPTVEPTVEETQPSRKELLRELSKEYGVNLFDADGLKQFKEYTQSQKSEQEKLQERLQAYENEKAEWQSKQLEYESKLKASQLGIKDEYLEDALKLANNEPDKLAEVVKKYPIFKAKGDISIGVQSPNQFQQPSGNSEAEAYMANDPKYKKYYKTKK